MKKALITASLLALAVALTAGSTVDQGSPGNQGPWPVYLIGFDAGVVGYWCSDGGTLYPCPAASVLVQSKLTIGGPLSSNASVSLNYGVNLDGGKVSNMADPTLPLDGVNLETLSAWVADGGLWQITDSLGPLDAGLVQPKAKRSVDISDQCLYLREFDGGPIETEICGADTGYNSRAQICSSGGFNTDTGYTCFNGGETVNPNFMIGAEADVYGPDYIAKPLGGPGSGSNLFVGVNNGYRFDFRIGADGSIFWAPFDNTFNQNLNYWDAGYWAHVNLRYPTDSGNDNGTSQVELYPNGFTHSLEVDGDQFVGGTGDNFLLYSQQFTNGVWLASGTTPPTVTDNYALAPDGTMTAALLALPDTTSVDSYLIQGTSGTGTAANNSMSIYAAAVSGTASFDMCFEDTNTGTWYSKTCNLTTTFSRCGLSESGGNALEVFLISGASGCPGSVPRGPQNILIWGAQLDPGASPEPYVATTSAAVEDGPSFYPPGEPGIVADFHQDGGLPDGGQGFCRVWGDGSLLCTGTITANSVFVQNQLVVDGGIEDTGVLLVGPDANAALFVNPATGKLTSNAAVSLNYGVNLDGGKVSNMADPTLPLDGVNLETLSAWTNGEYWTDGGQVGGVQIVATENRIYADAGALVCGPVGLDTSVCAARNELTIGAGVDLTGNAITDVLGCYNTYSDGGAAKSFDVPRCSDVYNGRTTIVGASSSVNATSGPVIIGVYYPPTSGTADQIDFTFWTGTTGVDETVVFDLYDITTATVLCSVSNTKACSTGSPTQTDVHNLSCAGAITGGDKVALRVESAGTGCVITNVAAESTYQ